MVEIIPPARKPKNHNIFQVALLQGTVLKMTMELNEKDVEIQQLNLQRRIWKLVALVLIAWIIIR